MSYSSVSESRVHMKMTQSIVNTIPTYSLSYNSDLNGFLSCLPIISLIHYKL